MLVLLSATAPSVFAQSCEDIPNPGTESISASITINGTGVPVTDGMVIPAYIPSCGLIR